MRRTYFKTISISLLVTLLLTSYLFTIASVSACRDSPDPWPSQDPWGKYYDYFKDWWKFVPQCNPKPPCFQTPPRCFVTPEVPIGTLGSMIAMIGAIALFVARSRSQMSVKK